MEGKVKKGRKYVKREEKSRFEGKVKKIRKSGKTRKSLKREEK